jgi:hypothetical protein
MNRDEVLSVLGPVLRRREVPGVSLDSADWERFARSFGRMPPDTFVSFVELLTDHHCVGATLLGATPGQTDEGDFELVVRLEGASPLGWPAGVVPFWNIGNGDIFALDLRRPDVAPVLMRNHADGELTEEASDFDAFVRQLPAMLSD